jgi:hypothetical protein
MVRWPANQRRRSLDAPGRRRAQLVFWLPALQLVFGGLQLLGPGFVARGIWGLSGDQAATRKKCDVMS